MAEAGDFGTAVYASLKKRCPEKGDMSVYDINAALDALNSATDRCLKLSTICISESGSYYLTEPVLQERKTPNTENHIKENHGT